MTKLTTQARKALMIPAALLLFLAACSPVMRFHGYAPEDAQLAQVVVGQDTRETVAEKLGRPGAGGVMRDSGWYYVQSDWRQDQWRAPIEMDRQVVAISFDANDRVSNVERFGLEQGEVVALSRRVTSTGPSGLSILKQILGNIGGFNAASFGN